MGEVDEVELEFESHPSAFAVEQGGLLYVLVGGRDRVGSGAQRIGRVSARVEFGIDLSGHPPPPGPDRLHVHNRGSVRGRPLGDARYSAVLVITPSSLTQPSDNAKRRAVGSAFRNPGAAKLSLQRVE